MGSDGFISYSHAADGQLAPALQRGLQRLAKPWNRRRALRIFRDETGLSTNPHLWSAVETALDDSGWFVLLASPEAARSEWVNKEVAHWLATKSADRVLPVVTDGTWAWDASAGDFAAGSTAVPAALRGAFGDEPRHLDLRWARTETDLDLRNTRFRDAIADLAAPMHGIAKDDLESEDVHQHRRTMRLAFAAGIALVVLTLASIATSAFAVNAAGAARRSASRARTEQHRADVQAELASRESKAATKASTLADQRRKEADQQRALADQRRKDADQQRALALQRQGEALSSASEADRQRGLADARALDVAAANGDLVLVNGRLVDQKNLTESQRARAVANATRADQQRTLADARAAEALRNKEEADRQRATALSNASRAERQRLAGVARTLMAGSTSSLAAGATDRALLLAAEATKFASRSHGLIGDDALRPPLVDALQRNPRLIGWLHGLDGPIADVAVAADGSRAAAVSLDGRAAVWQLPNRKLLSTFTVPMGATSKVTSPPFPYLKPVRFLDPDTLVVASRAQLDAYRATDGGATWTRKWSRFTTNKNGITAIAVTPPSALPPRVFVGSANDVDMFDWSGRWLGSVHVTDPVDRLAFAPNGTAFATAGLGPDPANPFGGFPGDVRVHVFANPTTETASFTVDAVSTVDIERIAVADMRFSADNRQITILGRGLEVPIHRWDIATHHEIPVSSSWESVVPDTPIGLSRNLDAIVQRDENDHQGQSPFAQQPDLVGVGHISTGVFTGNLDAPVTPPILYGRNVDPLQPPAFTPDGQSFLMPAGDSIIPVFELPDVPHSHYARTRSLRRTGFTVGFSPDGRILASVAVGSLRLTWLDGSRAPIDVPIGHPSFGRSGPARNHPIVFNDRGDEIAVANTDGSVDIFDTAHGTRRLHLEPLRVCRRACDAPDLAFSGSLEGGRIAESDNAELWTWDLRNAAVVASHVVPFPGAVATCFAHLSASGSRVAVTTSPQFFSSQSTTHILDATVHGWSERTSFHIPSFGCYLAQGLSPDGTRLAVVDIGNTTMHDLERRRVAWTTHADDQGAWFGPDGNLYTVSNASGAIRVRSAGTGSVQYTLDSTSAISGFPDALVVAGSHLLTAFTEPFVVAAPVVVTDWPLAPTDLAAAACKEAGRDLTPAEWKQYVGTFDVYEKTCSHGIIAPATPVGVPPVVTETPVAGAANQWPHVVVNGFSTPTGHGYWLVYANGSVTTSGAARYYGDASGLPLNGPLTGGAAVPIGTGYWLVAGDGGIFTYGTGRFYGSMGATPLNQPVFSMAPTKSGNGYWLVAGDGGIFTFGDAPFYGSTGNLQLNQPINGITTSPTGKGYRMVARDGGIFSFGDVPFYGSLPGLGLNVTDVVGMAPTPTNRGYWIVRSGGQVYAFGDAKNFGNYQPSACDPVSAIFANPNEQGYRLVTTSGATIPFGTAPAGNNPTGTPKQCPT